VTTTTPEARPEDPPNDRRGKQIRLAIIVVVFAAIAGGAGWLRQISDDRGNQALTAIRAALPQISLARLAQDGVRADSTLDPNLLLVDLPRVRGAQQSGLVVATPTRATFQYLVDGSNNECILVTITTAQRSASTGQCPP
jgi:hypothetical protein